MILTQVAYILNIFIHTK